MWILVGAQVYKIISLQFNCDLFEPYLTSKGTNFPIFYSLRKVRSTWCLADFAKTSMDRRDLLTPIPPLRHVIDFRKLSKNC